jgi:tetratricopeptide (TPR) repeat protein
VLHAARQVTLCAVNTCLVQHAGAPDPTGVNSVIPRAENNVHVRGESSIQGLVALAHHFGEQGEYEKAFAHFEAARAAAAIERGVVQEGTPWPRGVVESSAIGQHGIVAYKLQRQDEAVRYLTHACEEIVSFCTELSVVLRELGQLPASLATAESAIRRKPASAAIWVRKSVTYA